MMEYTFTRYLSAKKSVDNRALNRPVLDTLVGSLPPASPDQTLQVLELGAGIGTMLERLLEWQVLTRCDYLAIDAEAENIAHARQRLSAWAAASGFEYTPPDPGAVQAALTRPGQSAVARFEHLDLFDLLAQPAHQRAYDLLVAHSVLDLIDLPSALPAILNLLKPGGAFYFTLNFDGETIFEPTLDRAQEAEIIAAYHRSMDERGAGDSRTGRRLFTELPRAGGRILNAGASDWVVFPKDGAYPLDEAYFLRHILTFFEDSLRGRIPPETLAAWLDRRRAQIDRAELVYLAHQFDFCGIIA